MTWASEPELTPYQAADGLPGTQRLLVLAPHPDDEVLGCGGLIARELARGHAVHIVVVTDGALGGDAREREAESRQAAAALSSGGGPTPDLQFWGLPDRGLAAAPGLVPRLQHLLATCGADGVLLPSPFEVHPDHRALCLAALHALHGHALCRHAWFYEVGQPLMPDLLVDITPTLDRKQRAIACYASQLRVQAYDEQLLALNRYRAYTLGAAVTHAEAYQRVPELGTAAGAVEGVIDDMVRRLRRRFGHPA